MEDTTFSLIEYWKRHSPRPEEQIPFGSVMKALDTPYSVLDFREESVGRWGFHKRGTTDVAVFSFAGVIANTDDMQVGNLLPEGVEELQGTEWRKLQRKANSWCFYTIVLDTSTDGEMFELLKALDNFVEKKIPSTFISKTRRPFMSGRDACYTGRFWMQSPMFSPAGAGPKPATPTHLHPWIADAHRKSRMFKANLSRPLVYGRVDGNVVPIDQCTPNRLCPGDVVSVAFTVLYLFTDKDWSAHYQPVEVYVLKKSDIAILEAYDAPYVDRCSPNTMSKAAVEGILRGASPEDSRTEDDVAAVRANPPIGQGKGHTGDDDNDDLYGPVPVASAAETSRSNHSGSGEQLKTRACLVDNANASVELEAPVVQTSPSSLPTDALTLRTPDQLGPIAGIVTPPSSQFKMLKHAASTRVAESTNGAGSEDDTSKSSTSTISEENQARAGNEVGSSVRQGASHKRRSPPKGADAGSVEGASDAPGGKRRARKAARLA